jgi:hypothetical protein
MITVAEIHDSLENGNRRQMARQIKEYGQYDFWPDYKEYLALAYRHVDSQHRWFTDATISFMRIEHG